MTHVSRYLDERNPVRPSFAPGVRRAVIERDTPPGFVNPSCFFCKATVFPDEIAIHHEEPWVRLLERLRKDYFFQIADEEAQAEAIQEQFNYLPNLHVAHRSCNSADGFQWRDYEAARRHEQRVKEEPGKWDL